MKLNRFFLIVLPIILLESFMFIGLNGCDRNNVHKVSNIHVLNDRIHTESPCEKDSVSFFLKKFCEDSIFQYSRIKFPVKRIKTMDAYNEVDVVDSVWREEWLYVNFQNLPKNYIVSLGEAEETSFKLNVQIEDTGVSVNYVFELIDCVWYLTNIIDESI